MCVAGGITAMVWFWWMSVLMASDLTLRVMVSCRERMELKMLMAVERLMRRVSVVGLRRDDWVRAGLMLISCSSIPVRPPRFISRG